jgi:RimJ/RimL family protein N-acetyltransferase
MIGDPSCWGQGVGGDAWATVVYWLLDLVLVAKVVSGTLRCNTGMVNIMFNTGMNLTSAWQEYELIEGQSVDVVYFEKVNTTGN